MAGLFDGMYTSPTFGGGSVASYGSVAPSGTSPTAAVTGGTVDPSTMGTTPASGTGPMFGGSAWQNLPLASNWQSLQNQYGTAGAAPAPTPSTTSPTTSTGTTAAPTTGLRDMSGQTWGALGTVIPQGWSMDAQGNFVNTGASTTGRS